MEKEYCWGKEDGENKTTLRNATFDWESEIDSSAVTEIDQPKKKLNMSEQSEGGKLKRGD